MLRYLRNRARLRSVMSAFDPKRTWVPLANRPQNPSMTSCFLGTKSCRREPSRTRFDVDQYADCDRAVEVMNRTGAIRRALCHTR